MKTRLLFILAIMVAGYSTLFGQRNCAADEYLQEQIKNNPDRATQLAKIEAFTQKFIENGGAKDGAIVTIPVVVHVVYNTSSENLSEAQINSQIQILNEDFRRLNADADNTWPQAADTEIEFCLATVDPNGNATNGITRTSTSVTSFGTNDNVKFNSSGGKDAWPAGDYMNMWTCDLSGGLLGYAQFPGGPASTDGIVVDYLYFGNIGTATAPFDLGRTATHEVGHWLNLRHIWGDGGCSVDDFVSDTPVSDASNVGCATGHVSCGTTDMVQNYMDYSDDACMNLYTVGQRDRMQALFSSGGSRASLLNSNGCGTPGSGGCDDNDVSLTLVFDNYPEETSWNITDNGTVIESGGTYGSQADGSTLVIDLCLADGCYDFTIFDSYGDGMCCGYGNGSYSLESGGTVLASGGQFGSSETTNFCLGGGGDTEPPTTPGNLTASNITESSADLSWSPSSDNVGVTSYDVYVDGSYVGSTSGTSYSVSGLDPNTTYTMSVVANDAAGNSSSSASISVTTQSSGGGGTDVLIESYFETGWDGWQDGGGDCYRYRGSRSYEGEYSIRIRDNSSTASSMSTGTYDVTGYDNIDINFYFYAYSMENGEDFWVRFHDGSSWKTVAAYARGVHFNNNTFYVATVNISSSQYNFPSNGRFRFQCDASSNADQIYIDQVTITGYGAGARVGRTDYQTIDPVGSGFEKDLTQFDTDLLISPNPVSNELQIKADEDIQMISIFSIEGSLLSKQRVSGDQHILDVSNLDSGMYLLSIETEEETVTQKFIKI